MPNESPATVMYNRNYDKETQHEIEEMLAQLNKSINGYCTAVAINQITDANVVAYIKGEIAGLLQKCIQLGLKYYEKIDYMEALENYTKSVGYIEAPELLNKLKELQHREVLEIAVRHKLMDRTIEKEPWEQEVKKNFG